jgi:hypothetical protein
VPEGMIAPRGLSDRYFRYFHGNLSFLCYRKGYDYLCNIPEEKEKIQKLSRDSRFIIILASARLKGPYIYIYLITASKVIHIASSFQQEDDHKDWIEPKL